MAEENAALRLFIRLREKIVIKTLSMNVWSDRTTQDQKYVFLWLRNNVYHHSYHMGKISFYGPYIWHKNH